jgi:colanic acid biosynthesis protein WcaH
VLKNEPLANCLQRVDVFELGLQASDVQSARFMGLRDHFYEHSVFSVEVSTHYVNLAHLHRLPHSLDIKALPSDLHTAWRWQDVQASAMADDVHPYVPLYGQWVVRDGLLPAFNYIITLTQLEP